MNALDQVEKQVSVSKCHLFEQTTTEMPEIVQDFFFLKDTLYCKFGFYGIHIRFIFFILYITAGAPKSGFDGDKKMK